MLWQHSSSLDLYNPIIQSDRVGADLLLRSFVTKAKKKQVFVKFSVGNPDAPAADIGGEMPSEDPWLPQVAHNNKKHKCQRCSQFFNYLLVFC